jgi:1,4-dihydroxy-2-naphthoyl-CoA hydrolase
MEPSQEELLARFNGSAQGTVTETLGIALTELLPERVVATLTIGPQHRQLVGYLHGGVSVVLAETVASIGSVLNIDRERQMAFGLEINANHVRPKRDGILTAVATPIHFGRTTHIWDIKISDENNKLVCVSRCTVAIVDRPPDSGNVLA